MTQLGITITTNEAPATGGTSVDTGTAFMVGQADQGPVGVATLLTSFSQFVSVYGTYSSTSAELYNAVQTFFAEGGELLYVSREEGSSMLSDPSTYTASLTLDDQGSEPTVLVTYKTPGVDGNNYEIQVETTSETTFTATLTDSSTAMTSISSFANIGVGTPISGTGIQSGTYISAVNETENSATLSTETTSEAAGSDVVITPTAFTILITDPTDDPGVTLETWGPYANTAALYADASSAYVTFVQSTGSGHTVQNPATLAATALSGGADDSGDVSDTTVETALTYFVASYGPGQVSAPGQTDATIHEALAEHAAAFNRIALLDLADGSSASSVIASLEGVGIDPSYCIVTEGSGIIPGLVPNTTRDVAASGVVAALCAQVDATGNPNQAPCGINFPLQYVIGFTENFQLSDIQTMNESGINTWYTVNGVPCLYGWSTPVLESSDPIFWQASHSRLRMALVNTFAQVAQPFMFQQIDGQGILLSAFGAALTAALTDFYDVGALYGASASAAFSVNVGSSVNTTANLSAGIISAAISVYMSPFAQAVTLVLTSVPITQAL